LRGLHVHTLFSFLLSAHEGVCIALVAFKEAPTGFCIDLAYESFKLFNIHK